MNFKMFNYIVNPLTYFEFSFMFNFVIILMSQ